MPERRTYIAIDLKSFYASVECVERGLNPLTTHLVVADATRTEKTICLAVTPSLKAYGLSGRSRLFEVIECVRALNNERKRRRGGVMATESADATLLAAHPDWVITYHVAPPRMGLYIRYSARIYNIYLRYIAPDDIHVYSVDEVFIDATQYLRKYRLTAHELAEKMIKEVLSETGITATAGIGSNLYLCKVAMDIMAKRVPADEHGVRIAELDEASYRRQLWDHQPLTDFWRVGRGYAHKLNACGMMTMGDVARCSLEREELLYQLFGVAAELLIDHAWGWEPCTMQAIKAYRPQSNSFSAGQVLAEPYPFDKARLVLSEMTDNMALKLVSLRLCTDHVGIAVNYDKSAATAGFDDIETGVDYYGRIAPKGVHATSRLAQPTSSSRLITEAALALFDEKVDPRLTVRRLTLTVGHLVDEAKAHERKSEQLTLFADADAAEQQREKEEALLARERKLQDVMLAIKGKYHKNAILKGINLEEGATARQRNEQIGGHKA